MEFLFFHMAPVLSIQLIPELNKVYLNNDWLSDNMKIVQNIKKMT